MSCVGKSAAVAKATETGEDDPSEIGCDWIACKPTLCQRLARPSCLLFWLCLCSFTQGLLVNGFVNSVLTTLELRFDLSSSESGLIASSYDIGCVLCLVPVTYIGRRYRRSRLISIGALIMACGSFIFAVPHFTTPRYSYQSPVPALCYTAGYAYPSFCTSQVVNHYKWVFWLGQLLHGVGASPFYTLAVAYLDDNLSLKESGAFLGVYYTMSLIGPAVGYLLGGIFLGIYVDVSVTPVDLKPENTKLWVGAWWIGFILSACISLLIVVPMFGFPKSFAGSAKKRRQRKREAYGSSDELCSEVQCGAKDFLPSLRLIVKNPTFMFLSLMGAVDAILTAGLSTFGPKVLQTLFYMTSSSSTMTLGLISVPSAALGVLAGGLFIRFTSLDVRRLLVVCCGVSAAGLLLSFTFFIRCSDQQVAGVNRNYTFGAVRPDNLTAGCNSGCSCQDSKFMFNPLCGADSVTYFSPCYAGCPANGTLIDGVDHYANCGCVAGALQAGGLNYSAKAGACSDPACNQVTLLLVLLGLFMFAIFFTSVPTLQCTMRVIPAKLKDFGLGIQWIILRCLGSIPGPLLFGRLIDVTCSRWVGGCDSYGSCAFYSSSSFSTLVIVFVFTLKALELLFLLLATFLYRAPPNSETKQNSKEEEVNMAASAEANMAASAEANMAASAEVNMAASAEVNMAASQTSAGADNHAFNKDGE